MTLAPEGLMLASVEGGKPPVLLLAVLDKQEMSHLLFVANEKDFNSTTQRFIQFLLLDQFLCIYSTKKAFKGKYCLSERLKV